MIARAANFGYRLPQLADPTSLPIFIRTESADPYVSEYTLPEQLIQDSPELVQQLQELVRMTQFTNRTLALITGVTHPTIAKALNGDVGAMSRSREQQERLADAYKVVHRIFLLAGRMSDQTARALDTPDGEGVTAIHYLVERQITKAYLTAMRVLRPPQRGEMVTGSYPLDPRKAIVAVPDED